MSRFLLKPTSGVLAPTAIICLPEAPQVQNGIPSGVKIADLSLAGGTGAGTWSIAAGWAKASLSATTGPNIELRTNATIGGPDAGPQTVTVQYTGESLPAPLIKIINLTVLATAAPTAIDAEPDAPSVLSSSPNLTVVAVLTLIGGTGTGNWAIAASPVPWSKVSLSGSTGRSVSLRLNVALTAADETSPVKPPITVTYSNDGLTTPLSIVVSPTVVAPSIGGVTWRSGFNGDSGKRGPNGIQTYSQKVAEWRGRDIGAINCFIGSKTTEWSDYANNGAGNYEGIVTYCVNRDIIPILALPVCTAGDKAAKPSNPFSRITDGSVDNHIRTVARKIVVAAGGRLASAGPPAVTAIKPKQVALRLGHEMNLDSWPWSIQADTDRTNYTNYKAAFNHVARLMSEIIDGVFIDWCTHKNDCTSIAAIKWYPGSTYVTHITMDAYDANFPANRYATLAAWKDAENLNTVFDLAVQENKKFAVDEWGLRSRNTDGNLGGGDNPQFIQYYYDFFVSCGARLAWENFFNINEFFSGNEAASGSLTLHSLVYHRSDAPGESATDHTVIEKTPFNGTTATNYVKPSPVTTDYKLGSGGFVGSRAGTGLASAKYRELFGKPNGIELLTSLTGGTPIVNDIFHPINLNRSGLNNNETLRFLRLLGGGGTAGTWTLEGSSNWNKLSLVVDNGGRFASIKVTTVGMSAADDGARTLSFRYEGYGANIGKTIYFNVSP